MKDQLATAFGNCKNQQKCICTVKNSFETTSAAVFYIYDDEDEKEQPVKIVDEQSAWQLQVHNTSQAEIYLVKNDCCLVIDNKIKKCDCILLRACLNFSQ